MSAQDLVTQWQAEAATLRDLADTHRKSGMYELARGERLKADQLMDCATELQRIAPSQCQGVIEPTGQEVATPLADQHADPSPTGLPAPTPLALYLASTLSKPSLRMLLGFPPLPERVLASHCNTILNSRGVTEPLTARDLQEAARHLWRQRGHKPHLPMLSQDPGECPGAPAETPADLARSSASAPSPTAESFPYTSFLDSAEQHAAAQLPTAH